MQLVSLPSFSSPPARWGDGLAPLLLISVCVCVCVLSRVQLCEPRDCSPPGSSVHGTLQARILESSARTSSRGSSQGSNLGVLPCRQILYRLSHQGSVGIRGRPGAQTSDCGVDPGSPHAPCHEAVGVLLGNLGIWALFTRRRHQHPLPTRPSPPICACPGRCHLAGAEDGALIQHSAADCLLLHARPWGHWVRGTVQATVGRMDVDPPLRSSGL